jgi:putative thiamine transport system permease protein
MGAPVHEVTAQRTGRTGHWLVAMPPITVGILLLPIGAGLCGTLLPAFGFLPAIGGDALSLAPWRTLVAHPGFLTTVATTLFTGIVAAMLALALAVGLCVTAHGRRWTRRIGGWLAPVLATPHSAIAIGFAFLVAPSGWIVRTISPWLTGWTLPPDVATVGDPAGWALIAGLLLKEVPYLILMMASALNQVPAERHLAIARSLGYTRAESWLKVILPQVYPQIRLPLYAVIAFSLSVVDVALILGPSNPPTLSVLAVRWFTDADIRWYFPAAAAAILQLLLVVAVIAAWFAAERVAMACGRNWIVGGGRNGLGATAAAVAGTLATTLFALAIIAMLGLLLWSFAAQWRFPDALPAAWSLANWSRHLFVLAAPAASTLLLGSASTVIALLLVTGCLENESRRHVRAGPVTLWILYIPLLVPQVAFLFGAQALLVRLDLDGTLMAVVWAHLIFVLPYLFLSLADPWRAVDPRYARAAASLGATPARVFFGVKVPLLLRAIAIACAIGFAVSVGQYLPTLFAGNGRVSTLTTEAVTLASGADRRVIALYALLQSFLPFVVFIAAALVPARLFVRRHNVPARVVHA